MKNLMLIQIKRIDYFSKADKILKKNDKVHDNLDDINC